MGVRIIIPLQQNQRHGQPRHQDRNLLQVRVAECALELKHIPRAEKAHRAQQMPVEYHYDWTDAVDTEEEEVGAVLCVYSQLVCACLWLWC